MNSFVPLDLTTFDLVSPGIENNCTMADNGKYYYIEIKTLDVKKLYTYQPVRKNEKILKSTDGIYSYIIASTEKEKQKNIVHIYAVRTLSIHEINTKHTHLIKRVNQILLNKNREEIRYLYYAGELLKKGDTIKFNFMSGSYMIEYVPLIKTNTDVANNKLHIEFVKGVFYKYGMINADIILHGLIEKKYINLSERDIDQLVSYGAEVYEYENQEDCKYREKYNNLYNKEIMKFQQTMRIYEKYDKKKGLPAPVFKKPKSPVEGKLLILKNYSSILGKRKISSEATNSIDFFQKSKKRQKY